MATRRNSILSSKKSQIIVAILLVSLIVAARLLPSPPNFTPVAAVGLFAGVYIRAKWAIWLPIAGMMLSDLFLPGYAVRGRLIVYSAFFLTGIIGRLISRRDFFNKDGKAGVKIARGVFGTLSAATLFFLITNNIFLYTPAIYPMNFGGMMQSYTMGLPFFRFQLMGDLFYSGILFGSVELARVLIAKKSLLVKSRH